MKRSGLRGVSFSRGRCCGSDRAIEREATRPLAAELPRVRVLAISRHGGRWFVEAVGVRGSGVRLQRNPDGSTQRDVPGLFKIGFIFDPWGSGTTRPGQVT